jgi:hypothetical protein
MSSTLPLPPRQTPWPEFFRILILIAAALAITAPFLTGNIIGGVDARWYAYMLADYIEQARLGHILVPVGQGPFAWNGSVHLFRSAPVYMVVARFWDFLTLHRLNAFALQHLTVVTSAVAGTLGFYAAANRLIPRDRWIAAGLALLYLSTPSWLATVVRAEAYMSYMAFAALPIVLYGNARTAIRDDGRGYIILGAGLALVWMCHPPIAFISTIATLVIQSGIIMGRGIVSSKNLAAGMATFVVLAAYYFESMGELPEQSHTRSPTAELLQIIGFALFFIGLGRIALRPRSFGWAICAVAGLATVGIIDHPWFCWAVSVAGIWIIVVLAFRLSGRTDFERHAFVALFLSALAGAAIAEAWVGQEGIFLAAIQTFAVNNAGIRDVFSPLMTPMRGTQIFQPGWGLVAVFAASVASLFGSRPLGAKIFFAVSIGLAACYLRVPLVSNFLIGRFPIDFAATCGVPLPLRITPVIASFTAMAGVVWVSTMDVEGRKARCAVGLILGALVIWSGYQTVPFLQHSRMLTGTAIATDRNLRPENAMLDAYAYLLLPIPSYFSHGKTDPFIESRLIDGSGTVLVGPMEDAAIMEGYGFHKIRATTNTIPNSTRWFAAEPGITVEPHEHLLVRFEFDPKLDYTGYMILEAEHAYREYHLPDSGRPEAFGMGGSHTSVLSLWNTGSTPEHYKISESTEPGNDVPHVGALFANLFVSKLDASLLPVSLESFIPYRARVRSPEGGALETFRVYLPGYRATVDGNDVTVTESREHLASVVVPPGVHEVELRFVGTLKLRLAAALSGIGWGCLAIYCTFTAILLRRPGFG